MAAPLGSSLLKIGLIGSAGTGVVAAVSGVMAGTGATTDQASGFLQLKRESGVVIGRAKTGSGNLKIPQGATAFLLAYGDYCKWDQSGGAAKVQRKLGPVGEYEVTTMEFDATNGKIICFKL